MEVNLMKVQDIISCPENNPETIVSVRGENPLDSCDPMHPEYYHGKLGEIPNDLKNCDVLSTGWLMIEQCHSINVPLDLNLELSLKRNNSNQSQRKKPHML